MISLEYKKTAQWAMEYALQHGCQACRVVVDAGTECSFEYRDTQLEKLQQASQNKLRIELFVDGRYGVYSTNRMDKKEVESLIKNGIAATRYLAEDTARVLPDASRYYKGDGRGLQLCDAKYNSIPADEKLALAKAAVDEVYGSDKRIISVSGAYGDSSGAEYMIASNGFEGEEEGSSFDVNAAVSLKGDGDARPESWWFDSSIYWDDLIKKDIGTIALKRALQKLGQQKIKSGKYPMLVDNLNITRLLSPLVSAMYGAGLQQKNSFLLDKLNQKVVSEKLTITDNPHIPKAMGARWFDGEGVATKQSTLFDKGVLQTYFIDTYHALKMNTEPSIQGPSVLTLQHGDKNMEQLMATMQKGIWVTGFNGGNSNSSSGDFSFGIEGFLIENGKATKPINEMNITGNILTLWSRIVAIGNDPRLNSSWRIPSVLFEEVNFNGM